MQISVKSDIRNAMRELDTLQREQIPKAAARALNRTMDTVQSVVVKAVANETGLKQKDVRQALSRVRATWGKLTTVLTAVGKALNLIRFNARQTKPGVTASAWGKRRLYKGTFIANQGRTVFVRTSKARLPIRAVHGPSIPREIERDVVRPLINKTIDERWPVEFEHELNYRNLSGPSQ